MSGRFRRVEFIAPHHAPDLGATVYGTPPLSRHFRNLSSCRSRHPSLYKMTETGGSHD